MNQHDTAIAPQLFRQVMARFPSGVTVISAEADGEIRGMTANAFMSGSLSPPLCVISVGVRARMHAHLVAAGHFGVNILARGQEGLCGHFAGKPIDDFNPRFQRVREVPLLEGASAVIATRIEAQHDCGDHSLFIGRIVYMHDHERPPIVYHAGRYGAMHYGHEPSPVVEFW